MDGELYLRSVEGHVRIDDEEALERAHPKLPTRFPIIHPFTNNNALYG